jgi:hypothetical protein
MTSGCSQLSPQHWKEDKTGKDGAWCVLLVCASKRASKVSKHQENPKAHTRARVRVLCAWSVCACARVLTPAPCVGLRGTALHGATSRIHSTIAVGVAIRAVCACVRVRTLAPCVGLRETALHTPVPWSWLRSDYTLVFASSKSWGSRVRRLRSVESYRLWQIP